MAGGPNAAAVPCMHCLGKAERIGEGLETDRYRCGECGREFLINWDENEPDEPCWPPSAEVLEQARLLRERRGK